MCSDTRGFALHYSAGHGLMCDVATGLARSPHSHRCGTNSAATSSEPRLETMMKPNRPIPSKSASKFGKAKETKPTKPQVQRRMNVGRDARSGESLASASAETRAARVRLTRRDVGTSANEATEASNSPTAADPATTANVGETATGTERGVADANETKTAAKSVKPAKSAKEPKQAKAPKSAKPPKASKPAKPVKERKPKRVSALDAAATILADTGRAMRATELIAEMEARGLWKSPGGKTPESTLYAAIAREIAFKGDASRFARSDKGFFIARKAG